MMSGAGSRLPRSSGLTRVNCLTESPRPQAHRGRSARYLLGGSVFISSPTVLRATGASFAFNSTAPDSATYSRRNIGGILFGDLLPGRPDQPVVPHSSLGPGRRLRLLFARTRRRPSAAVLLRRAFETPAATSILCGVVVLALDGRDPPSFHRLRPSSR